MSSDANTQKSDTPSIGDGGSDNGSNNNEVSNNEAPNNEAPNNEAPMKSWLEVAKGQNADNEKIADSGTSDKNTNDGNEGNVGSWNGGQRPFNGAVNNYLDLMHRKLNGCVGCLRTRSDYIYADVKVDPNTIIDVQLDDGTIRKYKFHSVHYGPLKKREKRHWRSRDNIWERMGTYPPFRTLQIEMLREGYYLMDVSDPDQSKKMFIRVYRNKPETPLKLWHGYGVIPTLGAALPGDPTTAPGVTMYPATVNFGTPPGIFPNSMQAMNVPPGMYGVPFGMLPGMLPNTMQSIPPGMSAPCVNPPNVEDSGDLSKTLSNMKAVLESHVETILASASDGVVDDTVSNTDDDTVSNTDDEADK